MGKEHLDGGNIVGFTSVVGDLFHAGHVAMIRECHKSCDRLVVCVMANTNDRKDKNQPTQSLFERFLQVSMCKGVDECYACGDESDLLLAIKTIMPNVRFVGDDYNGKDFTGKSFCEQAGIKIVYNSRAHGLSTSELKKRIKE